MSVSSLVVAALPVPVGALGLIPAFSAQRGMFSTFTSVFCFLVLAFIFFSRPRLARLFFPGTAQGSIGVHSRGVDLMVVGLIAMSFVSLLMYIDVLSSSVDIIRSNIVQSGIYRESTKRSPGELSAQVLLDKYILQGGDAKIAMGTDFILQHADIESLEIRNLFLMMFYMGMFVFAVGAFGILAMKEYLQEELGISERTLLLQS